VGGDRCVSEIQLGFPRWLFFSELAWNCLLFSELAWNISGLSWFSTTVCARFISEIRWNSHLRYALRIGFISTLLFGPIFGLLAEQGNKVPIQRLSGLLIALYYGGTPYINHFILRFILWRAGCTPLRYVHFLDEASSRILLQRVGGGYRFVHEALSSYFANLGETLPINSEDSKLLV
jgi:hypothetical protein